MASQSHVIHESQTMHERTGGPRRPNKPSRFERMGDYLMGSSSGSRMPLDTGIHWSWRNPLNVIPALLLLCALIGIIGMLV